MGSPLVLSRTLSTATSTAPPPEADPDMDSLMADGRAIGVRLVLDLGAGTPSHLDDPLPVVVVPDALAIGLEGFPTYGV